MRHDSPGQARKHRSRSTLRSAARPPRQLCPRSPLSGLRDRSSWLALWTMRYAIQSLFWTRESEPRASTLQLEALRDELRHAAPPQPIDRRTGQARHADPVYSLITSLMIASPVLRPVSSVHDLPVRGLRPHSRCALCWMRRRRSASRCASSSAATSPRRAPPPSSFYRAH